MNYVVRYWRIIILSFLCWTVFGVFFALQSYVISSYFGQPASFPLNLTIWLICGYGWALLTPAVIYLSEYFPIERPRIKRNLAVHFLASAAVAIAHLSIFVLGRQLLLGNLPEAPPFVFWQELQKMFVISFHADLLTYWILLGVCHLRRINRRYLERERETARLALETSQLETKLARAQLDALRMQLHPHFLFNTLNSISVLMRSNVPAADQMLVRLSELLRVALKSESSQEVSLREELEFLRSYLEIEKTRFQDRLTVEFDVQNETLDALVPNLILQPLVENAIRHGVAPRAAAGLIRIGSKRENGAIKLSVSDNGEGLKRPAKESSGIGLKNTQERLEKLYGEKQKFEILSAGEGGFHIEITLPYQIK